MCTSNKFAYSSPGVSMPLLSNAQKLADVLLSHCSVLHRPIHAQVLAKNHSWLLVGCLLTFACKDPQWRPNAASSMLISCALVNAQQMDHHHDSKVGTLLPACGDLFIVHEGLAGFRQDGKGCTSKRREIYGQ